ncbi:MAG: hypothetical protein KDB26_02295 [Microthrixaceae bacterium]|nr:hypothetical protein [Microthrixaceae bacterium]
MTRWYRRAALTSIAACVLLAGCSNATEEFCDDLIKAKDLTSLTDAIQDKDFKAAAAQAKELRQLADNAPDAVRSDMQELARSVQEIVELLTKDEAQASVSENPADSTSEVEQLRNQLNSRFDDLDRRSARVSRWTSEKCGVNL